MQQTIQFLTKSRKTEMKPIIAKMQVVRLNSARLMMRKKNKLRRRRAKSLNATAMQRRKRRKTRRSRSTPSYLLKKATRWTMMSILTELESSVLVAINISCSNLSALLCTISF